MDLKDHARFALTSQRRFTDGLLEAFKTRQDWLHQVHRQANHAMWIVAHLGLADNMFASKFRPEVAVKPAGWDDLFWFGSEVKTDSTIYPAHEDVLAYFRERRTTLLHVLADTSDEELAAPAPAENERSPIAGAPCIGHAFLFLARHEAIHGGQLTIAHRSLGNPPMFRP